MTVPAARQAPLEPANLTTGRLRIDIDKDIHKLNIDKTPLMKIISMLSKEKTTQMKYEWLTKERRADWVLYGDTAATGAWAAGAAATGTIEIDTGSVWLVSAEDVLHIAVVNGARVDTNIYVDSVNQTTGVITARTVDGGNLDLSTLAGTEKFLNMSNSFELGSNRGTIKSHQPAENFNYIQIIQHPWGVVKTMQHVNNDAGGKEWDEMLKETAIQHEFAKEKTFLFGQKHIQAVGYQNGEYAQYFTGGALEAINSGARAGSIVTEAALTQPEFGSWINSSIYYAKSPLVFASERIFEALSFWLGTTIQTRQDEKTLGIAVAMYMNQYGETVKIVPHRELLVEDYNGYAFCLDMKDVKYKFLQGNDTHVEVGIQDPGEKKEINEVRTWFGAWLGNAKNHGVMKGVTSIA